VGEVTATDMIRIVKGAIDTAEILAAVADDTAGGTAVFIGTSRNYSQEGPVEYLDYEAYEPMALKVFGEIAAAARSRWEIVRLSMVHRVGRVDAGEASVVVAVATAHRAEAFEACRFLIDTLKKDAPIWKREVPGGMRRGPGP